MEDKEVKVGEAIVLECMASGSPKPTLRWSKNGGSLQVTDRHFFTAEDQLLIIMDTVLSDSGVYSCELTNSLGVNKGQAHLAVLPGNRYLLNIHFIALYMTRDESILNTTDS